MKKFFFSMIACLLVMAYAQAQRTVSGRVTDDVGEGLPGVNVVIKGTTTGTTTDIDGNYRLQVNDGDVLVYSFVGFEAQEINTGTRSVIDVTMGGATELQEVVVLGLGGEVDRRKLATTVDRVSAEDLASTPIVRIDQLLQSKLPNTQILQSTGAPGGTSIIRSRGVNSALLGQQPVIYIDGVRVDNLNTSPGLSAATGGQQNSSLADIPVDQIKDITFLKGGAATTLYGSDAANGVLLITTNKGQANQTIVTYEAQLGAIQGTTDYFIYGDLIKDVAFKTGFLNSHRIGFSGGNQSVTYNFFAKYRDDESFVEGLGETRYSIGGGYQATINDKLIYQGSFSYLRNEYTLLNNANSSFDRIFGIDQGAIGSAFGLSTNDPAEWTPEDIELTRQLVSDVNRLSDISNNVSRFTNSHKFSYSPIANLAIDATIGFDYRFSRNENIQTNEFLVAQGAVAPGTTDQGSISRSDRSFLGTTGTLSIKYDAEINDFTFTTIAGGQFFRTSDNQTQIITSNQAETSTSVNISAEQTVADFQSSVANWGFFLQETIGFKDKVYLDLGFRNDRNTAFGEDVISEFYPKAGISYVISEEPFWSGASNIVNSLKVRASYGEAGNFPPPFTRDAQLNANAFNGQLAFQPGQPGEPSLGPERLKTTEFGADLGFLSDKISVGVTVWKSITEDAIFTAPYAPSTGTENQPRNLGEIENNGVEITSSFSIINNSDWTLSFNASANLQDNKVVSSGGSPEFNIGGFTFLGPFVKEGLPVGYLRGSQPTFDESGNLSSVEQNANLGTPIPEVYGSLGLNASYKKLSIYISGDYQKGASGVNTDEVLRFFRGLDDDRIPEASKGESFFDLAGVWVEDTDFLKIRNITLTYDLSDVLSNVALIKGGTVSFSALNPFNFYSSVFDPELTGAGARGTLPGTNTVTQNNVTVGAFGYGTFSAPRQYVGTVRLRF
ncbi:TonB-dependent receptor [Ekhidna sp. MALMAid0563]|uniref:TonB-dependent receptor domain-containing protein n=1 Tax=Ekhidna sp. MALMAid0563 TaxID=3143937 RepID=UPI0032DFFEA0